MFLCDSRKYKYLIPVFAHCFALTNWLIKTCCVLTLWMARVGCMWSDWHACHVYSIYNLCSHPWWRCVSALPDYSYSQSLKLTSPEYEIVRPGVRIKEQKRNYCLRLFVSGQNATWMIYESTCNVRGIRQLATLCTTRHLSIISAPLCVG